MALNLRGPEAISLLKYKEGVRANLVESDTVAVLQAGSRTFTLPIFIQKNGDAAIESDFDFHKALTNTFITVNGEKATVLRFERIAEPVAPPAPPPTPTTDEIFAERYKAALAANPGVDAFMLRKRVAEQMHIEAQSSQYVERVGQQVQGYGQLNSDVAVLAEANRRARNGR